LAEKKKRPLKKAIDARSRGLGLPENFELPPDDLNSPGTLFDR